MAKQQQFDGLDIDAARIAFSGSVDDPERELALEETVTFVVKGRVSKVAFEPNVFGVIRRVHSVKVDHAVEASEELAAQVAADEKRRADAEAGQQSMDDDIDREVDGEQVEVPDTAESIAELESAADREGR